MIYLTEEQAQQIEEALHNVGNALMCLTATRKLRPMYQEMRDDAVECCNEALAAIREQKAGLESLVRFCPGCGSVGDVDNKYRNCCPDGGNARMIPKELAEHCHRLFELAVVGAAPVEPVKQDHSGEPTEKVEQDCGGGHHHRYAGSFGGLI